MTTMTRDTQNVRTLATDRLHELLQPRSVVIVGANSK